MNKIRTEGVIIIMLIVILKNHLNYSRRIIILVTISVKKTYHNIGKLYQILAVCDCDAIANAPLLNYLREFK